MSGNVTRDGVALEGRRLASEREDLVAAGVDPNRLEIPLHPESVSAGPLGSGEEASRDGKRSSRPGRHLGSEHQPSSAVRQTPDREDSESNG